MEMGVALLFNHVEISVVIMGKSRPQAGLDLMFTQKLGLGVVKTREG